MGIANDFVKLFLCQTLCHLFYMKFYYNISNWRTHLSSKRFLMARIFCWLVLVLKFFLVYTCCHLSGSKVYCKLKTSKLYTKCILSINYLIFIAIFLEKFSAHFKEHVTWISHMHNLCVTFGRVLINLNDTSDEVFCLLVKKYMSG